MNRLAVRQSGLEASAPNFSNAHIPLEQIARAPQLALVMGAQGGLGEQVGVRFATADQ